MSRENIIAIAMTGIIGFILSISLSQGNQPYIWQLDNSMQALLFLCIGYTYHRYEKVFNPINRLTDRFKRRSYIYSLVADTACLHKNSRTGHRGKYDDMVYRHQ